MSVTSHCTIMSVKRNCIIVVFKTTDVPYVVGESNIGYIGEALRKYGW